MIQSIMKIGRWVGESEGISGSLDNFVQNPNQKGGIQKVFCILLTCNDDGTYSYHDVDVEDFSEKKLMKYLYRKGSSRGADITPTAKFAGDISNTFKGKILKCVQDTEKDSDRIGLVPEHIKKIKEISKTLSQESSAITERLSQRADLLGKKEGAIVTLVFVNKGYKQYVGDIDLFKGLLKGNSAENYYSKYGKESRSQNQKCFVCTEEKPEVYGFVNTYNFYTVDQPGFVTGGFRQQYAWKNYPVCFDCATALELGKKYINEKLHFKFYGFEYLLVPKFFYDKIMEESLDILDDAFEKRKDRKIQAKFEQEYINRLTNAEDEIFDLISESKDYVSFDILFYAENKSAFNILLHVEDVLPSRFRKLFKLKADLDKIDIFREQISKEGKRLVAFNFGILRDFFPYISKTQSYNKNFLELTEKIFSLKPIDYDFIMRAIIRKLRSSFISDGYLKTDCLKGYLLLNYLAGLKILTKGGKYMDIPLIRQLKEDFEFKGKSISDNMETFFKAHEGFFEVPQKKACFLVGVLVRKLMNIQWRDKEGATPFRSRLQGLRLNENLIKKISYEAQEKLEQYRKNYYRELETVIAQYMVISGVKWPISNDEISFYFTMGMNLADLFKTDNEEEAKDERVKE